MLLSCPFVFISHIDHHFNFVFCLFILNLNDVIQQFWITQMCSLSPFYFSLFISVPWHNVCVPFNCINNLSQTLSLCQNKFFKFSFWKHRKLPLSNRYDHSGLLCASLGVWSKPRHVTVNASAVELYWDPPQQPHGHISQYKLKRDGRAIFTGDRFHQNYTDTGLQPHRR